MRFLRLGPGNAVIPSGAGSQGRIYGGVFIHHHENGADNETPGNLVICQDNTIHREGDSMNYLIILGAGAALAVAGYLLLKREQRRSTKRVLLLARIAKYNTAEAGGRAAGYYPGSVVDPRD